MTTYMATCLSRGWMPLRWLGAEPIQTGGAPALDDFEAPHPAVHGRSHFAKRRRASRVHTIQLPDTGVLVLSQYVEEGCVIDLLVERAGVVGYLLKDRVFEVERFARPSDA